MLFDLNLRRRLTVITAANDFSLDDLLRRANESLPRFLQALRIVAFTKHIAALKISCILSKCSFKLVTFILSPVFNKAEYISAELININFFLFFFFIKTEFDMQFASIA